MSGFQSGGMDLMQSLQPQQPSNPFQSNELLSSQQAPVQQPNPFQLVQSQQQNQIQNQLQPLSQQGGQQGSQIQQAQPQGFLGQFQPMLNPQNQLQFFLQRLLQSGLFGF